MPAAAGLARALVDWQRHAGRHDLPWQRSRDPYRVWLSEVMLQQTQVATVLRYFDRFVQRFPDVAALAAAPLDDVLAAWSGLGYYRRARHLHQCAQQVVQRFGGRFPSDSATLATLPGIGASTAAAIAAFCAGERAAILDGNVKRVLARVLGFEADLAQAANERELRRLAHALLPHADVDRYTQGLMDLGATVCLPRRPACERCPWQAPCVARRSGRIDALPLKTRRLKRGRRSHAWLWLQHRDRLWLVQRPPDGVWPGLLALPEHDGLDALRRHLDGWPGHGETLPPIDHALTHFDWHLQPLRWTLPPRLGAARLAAIEAALPPGRWVGRGEALQLALPAPLRRLLATP